MAIPPDALSLSSNLAEIAWPQQRLLLERFSF
jgi:hypothetical protein